MTGLPPQAFFQKAEVSSDCDVECLGFPEACLDIEPCLGMRRASWVRESLREVGVHCTLRDLLRGFVTGPTGQKGKNLDPHCNWILPMFQCHV